MIFAIIVLCVLLVFVFAIKKLEDKMGYFSDAVASVRRWQRHTHDRISSLEVKDFNQDFRLDNQDIRLEHHEKVIGRINKDVNALERDVGWSDDRHKTDVVKKPDERDPEKR